ncbi:hypothetical protein ACFXHA_43045 [Nocardia sp. NPDC059240]
MDSAERDLPDGGAAGCRYRISVWMPSPDDDLYDALRLIAVRTARR